MSESTIKELLGLTIESTDGLSVGDSVFTMKTTCGRVFRMLHHQDCCEQVAVNRVFGSIDSIIGSPVTVVDETDEPTNAPTYERGESHTWSQFRIETEKGYVEILWLGESNGYYGEDVSFEELENKHD